MKQMSRRRSSRTRRSASFIATTVCGSACGDVNRVRAETKAERSAYVISGAGSARRNDDSVPVSEWMSRVSSATVTTGLCLWIARWIFAIVFASPETRKTPSRGSARQTRHGLSSR